MKSSALSRSVSRAALGFLLAFALPCEARALSVRIAPLSLVKASSDEISDSLRPGKDLVKKLDATPLTGSVNFSLADDVAAAPVSFLDAARLCELHDYPYMIYGFLRKQGSIYSSELKLLSREGKSIAASFVATDDVDHYDRLVADLARKIADYFLEDLALTPGERPADSVRNLFELPFYAGYWTPDGPWSEGVMGIGCVDLGLRFIPRKPMIGVKSRPAYAGIGLLAEYALGKSRPDYEAAYLHRIALRLPLEVFLQFKGGSALALGVGGLVEFDVLRQDRKYGGSYAEWTSAGGIMTSLEYRYALSDRVALGLKVDYDAVLYSRPLYAISPKLIFEYSFAKGRDAGSE
jgi:hypothetical protein